MYPTANDYQEGLDRMLMYLGRHGKQDAIAMSHVPTVRLLSWVKRLTEMIEEEHKPVKK